MKKTGCLLMFVLFAATIFGQSARGFGFVVKGGNHNYKKDQTYTLHSVRVTRNAGALYSVGLWQAIPLHRRLRVSWEFVYRVAFFNTERGDPYASVFIPITPGSSAVVPGYVSVTQRHLSNSLSLPVKLEFLPLEDQPWLSVFAGLGLSHKFSERIHYTTEFSSSVGINFKRTDPPQQLSFEAFDLMGSFILGTSFRIDRRTSLGIEFCFEPHDDSYYYTLALPRDIVFTDQRLPPATRSFSLSLRHNLLH